MNIVLADDSGLLRESLAAMLERQGFHVLAQCSSAEEVMPLIDVHSAEISLLVTDVRMPPSMSDDGLHAAVAVRQRYPELGIVVCSQYVAPAYARTVLEMAGGVAGTGYVLKDSVGHVADFIRTLRTVAAGGMVIDPQVAQAMVHSQQGMSDLTARESEVLALMAQGLSNPEIASRLVVSGAAVAKHIAAIFQKLGLSPEEDNRRVKAVLRYLSDVGV